MQQGRDILIAGGRIAALAGPGEGPDDAERVDCGGRSVIPGLIDAHWHSTLVGVATIADGRAEVLRRAREQLMKGASLIKIMAGGGVPSLYDPLDSLQFLEEKMEAAVRVAADWGIYVCAHVYTSDGIRRALRAGVTSIEHGRLADLETVRIMRDEGHGGRSSPS